MPRSDPTIQNRESDAIKPGAIPQARQVGVTIIGKSSFTPVNGHLGVN